VVWSPEANSIQFSIPSDPQFANYEICAYRTQPRSEIPGPGEYLKHGWEHLTARSISYAWVLQRRPTGQGKTSLHSDNYFSFIPKENLDKARSEKLCMANLKPRNWR
jgi:hypothetical protein